MGIFDIAIKTAIGGLTGGPAGAFVGFQSGAAKNRAENARERQENLVKEQNAMLRNIPDPQVFGSQPMQKLQKNKNSRKMSSHAGTTPFLAEPEILISPTKAQQ